MNRRLFMLSLAAVAAGSEYPAPAPPATEIQLPGTWELHWGGTIQTCYFSKDGKYDSCRYGGGAYREKHGDGSATVVFQETTSWYVMQFDADGIGAGARVDWDELGDAQYSGHVTVRMRRTGNGEKRP
jgi:hypothetical protein